MSRVDNEHQIIEELKLTNKLLALMLVKDQANQTERIGMLDRFGFKAKDIANVLGINLNIVTAVLSKKRKAESRKPRSKGVK